MAPQIPTTPGDQVLERCLLRVFFLVILSFPSVVPPPTSVPELSGTIGVELLGTSSAEGSSIALLYLSCS